MIVERAYAAAMSVPEALKELWRCAGSKFDPRIVSAFCAAIDSARRDSSAEVTALAS